MCAGYNRDEFIRILGMYIESQKCLDGSVNLKQLTIRDRRGSVSSRDLHEPGYYCGDGAECGWTLRHSVRTWFARNAGSVGPCRHVQDMLDLFF